MKKRSLALLLALALALLALAGCGQTEASSPLFWQVENAEGQTLYLLGSIHAADESLYPLPEAIMEAFSQSDALAVEFDMDAFYQDADAQTAMALAMLCPDGGTIQDYVSPEAYDSAVDILTKQGLYSPVFDQFGVTYWSSLLDSATAAMAGMEDSYGVDTYFLSLAKERGMKVLEAESYEFQLDLLLNMPEELQCYIFESTATAPEAAVLSNKLLYQAYRSGDEALLTQLVYGDNSAALEQLENGAVLMEQYEQYQQAMYYDRNDGMAHRAEEWLNSGDTVFMVVGAGHMIGETGVAAQLQQRGYQVTKLCP